MRKKTKRENGMVTRMHTTISTTSMQQEM